MSYWIFQGNVDDFDVDSYVKENDQIRWQVRQSADEMSPGDEVFLWRAKGSSDKSAGVVAKGVLTSHPDETLGEDPAAAGLWRVPDKRDEGYPRVEIRLTQKCLRTRQVVRRKWLENDPLLQDHPIITVRMGTNFRLTPAEASRLDDLVKNTNRDWSKEESLAGLWAYAHTYGGPVSKLPGEPVASVALVIGRAVDGVYNKVMNFRHIDPRDDRIGLPNANQVDQVVWEEFFEEASTELDGKRLDAEFERLWRRFGTPMQPDQKPHYNDFGEAPDDDPEELYEFATRVRRGQPKFRKNMLKLYDERCAVTGTGPAEVLEAAHIVRHADSGVNQADNGLLLRADIHYLFDAGLLRIDPRTLEMNVDPALAGTPYQELEGAHLRERGDGGRPGEEFLAARYRTLEDHH